MSSNQSLDQVVFQHGVLVDLNIGRWNAQRKLDQGDLLLQEVDKGALYLGHKYLLAKEAIHPIFAIEGQARTFLYDRSIPFPISGGRFVTFQYLQEVLDGLEDYKTRFFEQVELLLANYERLREEQLQKLSEQAGKLATKDVLKIPETNKRAREARTAELKTWLTGQDEKNRELYPSKGELARRFSFKWTTFQVSGNDAMQTVNAAELAKARAALEKNLQGWVRDTTRQMHQAVGEAAHKALTTLKEKGRLTARNLEPLVSAFSAFQSMNFVGSDVNQVLNQVLQYAHLEMGEKGDVYSPVESSAQLQSLLETVGSLAVEEVAKSASENALRKSTAFSRCVELD
jgi:hypothetical protein